MGPGRAQRREQRDDPETGRAVVVRAREERKFMSVRARWIIMHHGARRCTPVKPWNG